MNRAPQPDLNLLDRDELVALVHAHQEELASLAADRDEQIRRLEAEVDSHLIFPRKSGRVKLPFVPCQPG